MTEKRIVLEDIQTSDLLYYDPDFKEVCFRFCQERDIDCLPALDDPLKYYRKVESGFTEEIVTPERMVDGGTFIFEQSLLERFRASSLLFVYTKNELTGVVHFSDFNRPAVDLYLFGLLSAYEKSLRRLLVLHGLKNQDMLDYFQMIVETTKKDKTRGIYSRKKDEFDEKRDRNEKLPVFESFYLLDLIDLAKHKKIISLSPNANDLRNMIMHAHELVNKDDASRDDYIYNFASFEKFFNQVISLLRDCKRVNNKIAFLELSRG